MLYRRFKIEQIVQFKQLEHFLLKYSACEINCGHDNLKKLPEVLSGTIKKLMLFVEALKKGENVTVESHFAVHKSKKVLKEQAVESEENKKQSKLKRKSADAYIHSSQSEHLTKGMHLDFDTTI